MAICQDKGARASEARHLPSCRYISSHKPERPLASGPNIGYPDRHDQSMAQGSRASVCQRAVGEHSLSSYGSIGSVNRPVRTRMRGGVGAGGLKPPATRLAAQYRYQRFLNLCLKTGSIIFNDILTCSSSISSCINLL